MTDGPRLVTGQQGSPSPACRQLSRAPNACAECSREAKTKLGHGTKLGRTLCYKIQSGGGLVARDLVQPVQDTRGGGLVARDQVSCSLYEIHEGGLVARDQVTCSLYKIEEGWAGS